MWTPEGKPLNVLYVQPASPIAWATDSVFESSPREQEERGGARDRRQDEHGGENHPEAAPVTLVLPRLRGLYAPRRRRRPGFPGQSGGDGISAAPSDRRSTVRRP